MLAKQCVQHKMCLMSNFDTISSCGMRPFGEDGAFGNIDAEAPLVCPVTEKPCTCPDYCNSNGQGSDLLSEEFRQAFDDPCSTIRINNLGNLAVKFPVGSADKLLANALRNQVQDDRAMFFKSAPPSNAKE
jgi:hypothetical protein